MHDKPVKGRKRIFQLVGVLIDGLYDNGNFHSGLPESFLPPIPENEVYLIRNFAFATNLVKPVREYDIDLGEEYDTKEVMLTDIGMYELSVHGSFQNYRKSWRQIIFRTWFTFIRPLGKLFDIGWDKFGKLLTPINTLVAILATSIATILSINQYRKDNIIERITIENTTLLKTVDSLKTTITNRQQQFKIQESKTDTNN